MARFPVEKVNPRMIFLPSCPKMEEWTSLMAANKNGVVLTGSAAMGKVGPIVGRIDIGESEDSYLFRVSLPGVKNDEKEFSYELENDGKVVIKGVTTTGEKTVDSFGMMFEMQSQNLCPSGNFSITFQLPGPINPSEILVIFEDGIFECIVKKMRQTC